MEENKLYIPMGLKVKKEYFNGFGNQEIKQALITATILNIFNLVVFFKLGNATFLSVFFLTSAGASIMVFTKDSVNLSLYDKLFNLVKFIRSQKKYEYIYLDEWRVNKFE